MAHSVCDADPRRIDQRRANALIAAVTHTAFGCTCGEPDCTGGPAGDAPAKNAVVYVVADEKSVDAATAAQESDACRGRRRPDPEPPRAAAKPAYVFGAGIMPTALLGGILERARIREVRHPGASSPPEPRYTPSKALCEFVRCRDLTCRFPGCDKPAQVCDLDHTVAYPVGPTHPSNLKCLCRFHHLTENVLERPGRLARPTTTRRNHHLDQPNRPHLCHLPRQPAPVPEAMRTHRHPVDTANHPPPNPPATAAR